MSAVGKGRGRGFCSESALRRPGSVAASKVVEKCNLVNLINTLSINDESPESAIDDIVNEIITSEKKNLLDNTFDTIHKEALNDREFGKKLAIAMASAKLLQRPEIESGKLRRLLFCGLQADFENWEQIKQESVIKFRNSAAFLGEIFQRLRISNSNIPIRVLHEPFFHYMKVLLEDSNEDDIEIVTTQVYNVAAILNTHFPEKFEQLFMDVRQVLINRNLSAKSRGMLLFLIETSTVFTQQCPPLTPMLQEFYGHQLGLKAFTNIRRQNQETSMHPKLNSRVNGRKVYRPQTCKQIFYGT